MTMTPHVALANLIIQCVLIVWVGVGASIAVRRRYRRHCLVMRSAVAAQILSIGIIMAPSLARYISHWSGWSRFTIELVVHHSMGVIVLLLFIYINLAYLGVVKAPRRTRPFMLTALSFWTASLGLGIYLFWYIWR
ncbi:MAG: hypothetical protein M1274_09965 [Actinobacteria bacterium]|nr:hypothetical protein [Actinomycetota bacterium]